MPARSIAASKFCDGVFNSAYNATRRTLPSFGTAPPSWTPIELYKSSTGTLVQSSSSSERGTSCKPDWRSLLVWLNDIQPAVEIMQRLCHGTPQFSFSFAPAVVCKCIPVPIKDNATARASMVEIPPASHTGKLEASTAQQSFDAVFKKFSPSESGHSDGICKKCSRNLLRQVIFLDRLPFRTITGDGFARSNESIKHIFKPITVEARNANGATQCGFY
ncbi:Hypothetical protein D9617_19g102700 [Elsinoe fawcettii]|nr:Hypothetical protein D9617_19g102700 [Elsinoe fawcettii]